MDNRTAAAVRRLARRAGVDENTVVRLFVGAVLGRPTEEFNFLAAERYSAYKNLSVGAIAPSEFDRPVHSRDSKGVGRARSNGRSKRKVVQA